jgi:hypothetical protein
MRPAHYQPENGAGRLAPSSGKSIKTWQQFLEKK